ncbi:MAG: sulfatase-like hydrolase/transferase [Verrucomicrobiales bacterium]|nr:sulfatase-like hydrolase/transferase [Verrucomicrobiales bacterium]
MNFRVLLIVAVLCATSALGDEVRPNVVFVLADDLGWADVGCYGNDFHETPNLDRMAGEGMRFTQAYAAAPVCSPYRAAFLTGQHPARLGILDYLRPNSANGLSKSLVTLPEALEKNGYETGMVGKWHLTGYRFHEAENELRPTDHGFGWNVGSEVKGVGNGANTWPYRFRTQPIRWLDLEENRLGEMEYLTDRLNLEAVEFIDRCAIAEDRKPFFLYLAHYAPHTILNGRADLVEKYIRKHPPGKSGRENCYICEDAGLGKGDPGHHWAGDHNPHLAAMLESIDDGIGKIASKLEELGLAENTIFVFTSDNGGESNVTSNAPLRGGKSELYEGGIRVPLIVRWPAKVKAGVVQDAPTMNTDFFPTILEAVGADPVPDQAVDGVSMLPLLEEVEPDAERPFFWHYPLDRPHFLGGFSGGAIRVGDWKLIERFDSGMDELFNLESDPGESTNLAAEQPERIADFKAKLAEWRSETAAKIPSPPLLTEMRQLYFADHFTPGLVSERLWYGSDFVAEDGLLKRVKNGSNSTRIFLRDAEYSDVVIRFDFRRGESKDLRLMTGSHGPYNTVIHIRPDHFFIQTAKDPTGPYFSFRHGECAFEFEPDRWYSMTIEFSGEEAVAHIDRDHLARAKHPMIAKQRTYLALQVDDAAAEFDNFMVFHAKAKKGDELAKAKEWIESVEGKHPVQKSAEEEFQIRKTNAQEWYFQRDQKYRELVERLDELDEEMRQQFPAANKSNKDFRKDVANLRKKLHDTDPVYKETLVATHRASRAIEQFLLSKKPSIDDLPNSRKKAEIERLRVRVVDDPEYQVLVKRAKSAQAKLEADYPQLFVSDKEINEQKREAQQKLKENTEFKAAKNRRAAVWREIEAYLLEVDPKLAELKAKLE